MRRGSEFPGTSNSQLRTGVRGRAKQALATLVTTALLAALAAFGVTAAPAGATAPNIQSYFTVVQDTSTPIDVGAEYPVTPGHAVSVVFDASGNRYVAEDDGNRVLKTTPGGVTTVVAGNGEPWDAIAGPATQSPIRGIKSLALDKHGNLFIVSWCAILKVTPEGQLSYVAGTGGDVAYGTPTEGKAVDSRLAYPSAVAVDSFDNLYIADAGNSLIEKVTSAGDLSIFAGIAGSYGTPVPGPAISSPLKDLAALAIDGSNNLFVADEGSNVVAKITPQGELSIVAGTGDYNQDPPAAGPALLAEISPKALALAGDGTMYIGQKFPGRILKVTTGGTLSSLAGNSPYWDGLTSDTGEWPAQLTSVSPVSIAVNPSGSLFVADTYGAVALLDSGVRPTLSVSNIPAHPTYSESFTPVFVTDSDGATSVTTEEYSSVCSSDESGLVAFIGIGTCRLTLNVAAGASTSAWHQQVEFTVEIGDHALITNIGENDLYAVPTGSPTDEYPDGYTLEVAAGSSGRTWVSSSTADICTISDDLVVRFIAAGTCTLTAHADAAGGDSAITGSPQDLTVFPAERNRGEIRVENFPWDGVDSGTTFTPDLFVRTDYGAVTLTVRGDFCTIDANNVITFVGPTASSSGEFTCPLHLELAATDNFDSATNDYTITLKPVPIVWGSPSVTRSDGSPFASSIEWDDVSGGVAVNAETYGANNFVQSTTESVCMVFNGSLIEPRGQGTCILRPVVNTGSYTAQQVDGPTTSFTILGSLPSIPVINQVPVDGAHPGGTWTPNVNSTGDGVKSVTSSTPSVCTVTSGTVVHWIAVGQCQLVAHITEGNIYLARDGDTQTFTVSPLLMNVTLLSITNMPASPKAGDSFTPSVYTNGDGVKSVTSSTTGVCTVNGSGVVSFLAVGTCRLQGRVAAGATYDSASGPLQSVTVAKGTASSPSISNLPGSAALGGSFTPSVSTNGDGVKSVTSSSTGVCTVNGSGVVSFVAVGTCTLVAHVAEGSSYHAADGSAQSVTVAKAAASSPSISNLPGSAAFGGSFTPSVSTNGDGVTSVSSSTVGVCTVNGSGVVSFIGAGTCTLVAHVADGSTYAAADGSPESFTVAKLSPTAPSISNVPGSATVGGSFTPSVSTNGDGVTSVSSSTVGVCTVNGSGVVSFNAAGTCTLTSHVAIGTNYLAADGSAQSVTVAKVASSTPSISNMPSSPKFGDSFTPLVSTSGDGVKSVTSSTTGVCTVGVSGVVSFIGVGTCTLVAHVAEGSTYQAAVGSAQSATVGKATPSAPSISNVPGSAISGGSFTPLVSTSGDGVKSVTSSTTSVCTVGVSGAVSYIGAGTCTLVAHVADGSTYSAADGFAQSFTVAKQAASSPSIANLPGSAAVGGSFTPSVTTTGNGTKSVTSSTTSVCTVNGSGVVSYVAAGTCTLVAHVAEGSTYLAADGSSQSFTVGRGTPTTPSVSNVPGLASVGGSFTPSVSTTGDGVKSVTSSSPAVCTVNGSGVVAFLKSGTCSLTARVAIGTNYVAGSGSAQSFTVLKTPTTPSVSNIPSSPRIGGSFTPAVPTTGDGVKSVTSSTTGVCTVNGSGVVSFIAAGTCSLAAHVGTGTSYSAADGSSQSFSVGRVTPTAPSVSNVPGSAVFGGSFTPLVSTSGDGVKSVTSSTTGVCTVNGSGVVSFIAAGTCTLAAHVAEGSTYVAADGSARSFTVAKASPTAPSISNLPGSVSIGGSFTPSVSTSGDGAKSVTISTPAVCTINGAGLVTFLKAGTCTLTASVAVGTNYFAGAGSAQSITVLKVPSAPSIVNLPTGDASKFGGSFTPSVSTTGDGTKSVTSSTTGVCTVADSGLVSFLAAGTCTLVPHVAAGSSFDAADGSGISIMVGRATPSAPTISNIPGSPKAGDSFTPSVSTTGDGVISVTSFSPFICSVNGSGLVTFLKSGTCRLIPRVAIGTNYLAAIGAVQTFSVKQA